MTSASQPPYVARQFTPAHADLADAGGVPARLANDSATYEQVGAEAGNGWQRQDNGGAWGADWFGRAQAAIIYIYVNDFHEAIYFMRGTDDKASRLQGRYRYTMTFPKGALPPVDRDRGGFWSLTMYDRDYFMLGRSPNGRTNIGTVSLDADELKFGADGSLTLHLSHAPPECGARQVTCRGRQRNRCNRRAP